MNEKILSKQNEVIISLLARNKNIFGEEKIKRIITQNKRNPNDYIRGYNSCNGKNTVTELANIIRVKQPTLTPILKFWENEGIIFNMGEKNKPLYVKLLNLEEDKNAGPKQGDLERVEETESESPEANSEE